jgi:hypothetical protein
MKQIKRIVMSLLLAGCFLFMAKVPASADQYYVSTHIEIGDDRIDDITQDASGNGWSYEADTCTITLNNYSGGRILISLNDDVPESRARLLCMPTIVVEGENTVEQGFSFSTGFTYDQVWFFKGNGTLNITPDQNGIVQFPVGDTIHIACKSFIIEGNVSLPYREKIYLDAGTVTIKNDDKSYISTDHLFFNGGTLIASNVEDSHFNIIQKYDIPKWRGTWTAYDEADNEFDPSSANTFHYIKITSESHTAGHIAGSWTVTRKATTTKAGKMQIKCTECGKVMYTAKIDKLPKPSITLSTYGMTSLVGKKYFFTIDAKNTPGDKIKKVTCSSSKIAKVSYKGDKITILGKKPGTVKIKVTMKSGATATCKVKIEYRTEE